ncbi:hypothetical protein QZH41_007338 [Actinostola sp. cb2023]|nr:hypothetical protein QZH41_007338 [Actinostola sp. cb2023]
MKPFRSGERIWRKAIVMEKLDDRSYYVESQDGGTHRRNRQHLNKSREQPPPTDSRQAHISTAEQAPNPSGNADKQNRPPPGTAEVQDNTHIEQEQTAPRRSQRTRKVDDDQFDSRDGHCSATVGSKLFVFGGVRWDEEIGEVSESNKTLVFDSSRRMIVFGGRGTEEQTFNDLHLFDMGTGPTSSPGPSLLAFKMADAREKTLV